MEITTDELTLLCAFRYALGRRTYIVYHVANEIIKNKNNLTDTDKYIIIKEITEAEERDGLGMECDKWEWIRVRDVLSKTLPLGNKTGKIDD